MNANTRSRPATAWRWAAALLMAALALAPVAQAQTLTGNIIGNVTDEQGARLPGVTVTLTGNGAKKTQTTDARGEYRFPSLSPGVYTITYELQSFTFVTKPDVKVSIGQNTEENTMLKISSIEATISVSGGVSLRTRAWMRVRLRGVSSTMAMAMVAPD